MRHPRPTLPLRVGSHYCRGAGSSAGVYSHVGGTPSFHFFFNLLLPVSNVKAISLCSCTLIPYKIDWSTKALYLLYLQDMRVSLLTALNYVFTFIVYLKSGWHCRKETSQPYIIIMQYINVVNQIMIMMGQWTQLTMFWHLSLCCCCFLAWRINLTYKYYSLHEVKLTRCCKSVYMNTLMARMGNHFMHLQLGIVKQTDRPTQR